MEGPSAVILKVSQAIVKFALDVRSFIAAGFSDKNRTCFYWNIFFDNGKQPVDMQVKIE